MKRRIRIGGLQQLGQFSCADTWGGPDYHGIFAFCENNRTDEGTHDRLFA